MNKPFNRETWLEFLRWDLSRLRDFANQHVRAGEVFKEVAKINILTPWFALDGSKQQCIMSYQIAIQAHLIEIRKLSNNFKRPFWVTKIELEILEDKARLKLEILHDPTTTA